MMAVPSSMVLHIIHKEMDGTKEMLAGRAFRLVKPALFGLLWTINVGHLEYPCYTHTLTVS